MVELLPSGSKSEQSGWAFSLSALPIFPAFEFHDVPSLVFSSLLFSSLPASLCLSFLPVATISAPDRV